MKTSTGHASKNALGNELRTIQGVVKLLEYQDAVMVSQLLPCAGSKNCVSDSASGDGTGTAT